MKVRVLASLRVGLLVWGIVHKYLGGGAEENGGTPILPAREEGAAKILACDTPNKRACSKAKYKQEHVYDTFTSAGRAMRPHNCGNPRANRIRHIILTFMNNNFISNQNKNKITPPWIGC